MIGVSPSRAGISREPVRGEGIPRLKHSARQVHPPDGAAAIQRAADVEGRQRGGTIAAGGIRQEAR